MLRKMMLLFFACFLLEMRGYGWEFEQGVVIEGVLRNAERTIVYNPDSEAETRIEKSVVLVTDEPLVLSHSITMGNQQITSTEASYPHIRVYLPEEFMPLIRKRVQCHAHFERNFDSHEDEIILSVNTALDCEHPKHKQKTVFYEPDEVELVGVLYKTIYAGPPEYTSIEMGDASEEVTILTLREPINVEVKENDNFNEPEKGVRELQVVFSDSKPSQEQSKREITLNGTLYHSHTAHHRRRVLMMVENWKPADLK
jgi:hypothetical protein